MFSNAFTLPFTFYRQSAAEVLSELKSAGFTGINLALNYHASRDFLLRQGPQLQYLSDGFHYYLPNKDSYPTNSITPFATDHEMDNSLLDSILIEAKAQEMNVSAWCVFMHNSAIGIREPEATVINTLGNRFLSELCPSNPRVRNYALGLVADLTSRGIKSIVVESLHWHGARHGEHHERFFMELSPTTEFLFSLCFCKYCIENFNGDGEGLKAKVEQSLAPFLEEHDPWLDQPLTRESLSEILGPQILDFLKSREATLSDLYQEVHLIAKTSGAEVSYVDQTPIMDQSKQDPLNQSWLIGVDHKAIRPHVDVFLPLIYRETAEKVTEIYSHYKTEIGGRVSAILRPTYPDNDSEANLISKVSALSKAGILEIDFYLLDTWRPKNLTWVANALSAN
jgi:hypothetical protein